VDHDFFVLTHAVAATVALVAALPALRTARFLALHAVSTFVMAIALVPGLALSRSDTPAALQVVFAGRLTGFATVGVLRLGGGKVAVTAAAVLIPVVGHRLLQRRSTRAFPEQGP
jgi:hypothetical protein